jgi:predicted nucleic acid-binding protein
MIYLDASFLFSLHFRDCNSDASIRLTSDFAGALVVSALCEMETINAFALRVFRGEMSQRNMDVAIKDLESDFHSGLMQWKPVPDAAFQRAKSLSRMHTPRIGVRAADLLHVATALELGANSVFTFDTKQTAAAKAAGLTVNGSPEAAR